ncbi:hypothetical protein EFY79_08080 [Hanamia caeni]|jgi:hypothetical protein|uniref:Uncharacterized protein n=1 Tax=Hanamia caeni TaxID=2294116 RepID=A0A3M9NJ46_9BACT|nr:hypothetical protein [Hanamia caeni]RNI37347.1 hypothetical protein EFY79_08080 [Hanamia caeni]
MKQIILGTLLLFCGVTSQLKAQSIPVKQAQQFMQVTTVESVLSGGLGRSKMIVTNPDGSQKESGMENLFSMVGINFKNIGENENKLINTLKFYTENGWKIDHVTSLTLSQTESGNGGIFMTRYLLSKQEELKN